MGIKAIIFDFGNTLIEQKVDSEYSLDELSLKLLPNVQHTLETLHCRYKIGLLSNTNMSTASHVSKALNQLCIGEFFDAVTTSYEMGVEKPDPRIFESILDEIGVSPTEAVMIGDDPEKDIKPAARLGMKTGLFTKFLRPEIRLADFQFTSYEDLPRCIELLEGACRLEPLNPE